MSPSHRLTHNSTVYWLLAVMALAMVSFMTLMLTHRSFLISDYSSLLGDSSSSTLRSPSRGAGSSALTYQEYIRIGSLFDVPPDDSPPNIPTPPLSQEELEKNQAVADRVSVRSELVRLRTYIYMVLFVYFTCYFQLVHWSTSFNYSKGYKGDKDALHLGGFTAIDMEGISPLVWKDMLEFLGVRSLLDIGCGKAVSTSWFYLQGVESFCVEGSQDALGQSLLPKVIKTEDGMDMEIKRLIIEHDFSRGPWWPHQTVDAVWCVEFLEHVGRPLMFNYMTAMKRAAVIFASHSLWGGWHHVEVHEDAYWIGKFESVGFRFSRELTERYRKLAQSDAGNPSLINPSENYTPRHLIRSLLVRFVYSTFCVCVCVCVYA